MRSRCEQKTPSGFTLIELLVVIGIIAVLAAILLPVLSVVRTKAKVGAARREMQQLTVAIQLYQGDYNHYPTSPAAAKAGANTDFTYGTTGINLALAGTPIITGLGYETNNSELVTILMAIDQGGNRNHARNPRRTRYWDPKLASGPMWGVSMDDYIARDPWGSPYIVTVDLNDDNKCLDPLYRRASVSERQAGDNGGLNGLFRMQPGDNFECNGPVMIWSAGPDATYAGDQKANAGPNRNNVLSWVD